jgi:hypothetical protein
MVFYWNGDNQGPHNATEIIQRFNLIQNLFPNANIIPSTFERFVDALPPLDKLVGLLPVIDKEIGDTWVHGVASDPLKVAKMKNIQRLRTNCLNAGQCDPNNVNFKNFSRFFIKNGEHTWGSDCKSNLKPVTTRLRCNYSNAEFNINNR